MASEEYTRNLEMIIKNMLQPLRGLPFPLVIEASTGHRIPPFDRNNKDNLFILEILEKAAYIAGKKVNEHGIKRTRPNEVGNDIEIFVKEAIQSLGLQCGTPKTASGTSKSAGYPDLYFVDNIGRTNFLECKTYNLKNINTTQRSFYYSPSNDHKIFEDGFHFIISFQISSETKTVDSGVYKAEAWKLLTLDSLLVDVKYEFNSDNRRLYTEDNLLAEGKL